MASRIVAATVTLALSLLPTVSASIDLRWPHKPSSLQSTYPNLGACLSAPHFYSCENTTTIENTCCSPTPGGLVLLTQFWSTYTGLEHKGQLLPKESWTLHGLWPDNCDGSYEQYCDLSRQYDPAPSPAQLADGTEIPPWTGPSIDNVIKDFGRDDMIEYMNKYWINQNAPNADLWAHEFSKHATCTSTFDIDCYEDYQENEDVINFFDATLRAFHQYPSYDILASVGIVPSNETTYKLETIQSALAAQTGATPFVGCIGGSQLSELWYFSHVWGTEQYGTYKPVDSTTPTSCDEDVWYYLRADGSEHELRKDDGGWWPW